MKKLTTLILTLAMVAPMTTAALASDIQPNDLDAQTYNTSEPVYNPYYDATLVLNGETLDTATFPNADGIPMRLLAETDGGSAVWYSEMKESYFYFGNNVIAVAFRTGEVHLNGQPLVDISVELLSGVTYLSYDIMNYMEGYSSWLEFDENQVIIQVKTPSSTPMAKLSKAVASAAVLSTGMVVTEEELGYFNMTADGMSQWYAMFPMMTNPDTILVAELTEDADIAAIEAQWNAYVTTQEDTFSWYLVQNLPRVEDARFVVYEGFVLCLIAEDAQAGVDAFYAYVDAMIGETL